MEVGVAEKRPQTEKSDTETEAVGEAGPSESRYKKGNIYLTDSDETIVDFVKDHKELYHKTNEHFVVSGSSSPTVSRILSRCARPGLTHKGHVMGS